MYFYKRGKGRYRKAPPDALKAALASVERKRREAEQIAALGRGARARGACPTRCAAKLPMLLYKPDKNALEWKALAAACDAQQTNPVALLAACGAIPSTHDYHFNAFLARGVSAGRRRFRPGARCRRRPSCRSRRVRAFSIDDATTTEIDDAFSVRELPDGHYEIGIHIAVPGARRSPRGSALDAIARERLSTVYMPGRKITMLPDEVVAAFTLAGGHAAARRCRSYVEVAPTACRCGSETRVERVPIAANLRLDALGDAFANDAAGAGRPAVDRRAARAVEARAAALSPRAARPTSRASTTASTSTGTPGARRARARSCRGRAAPARQARRRADDPRQQHLGPAARRCAASPGSIGRSRRAR